MHDIIAAALWVGLVQAQWAGASVLRVISEGPRRGLIVQGEGGRPVQYAQEFDQERFLDLWLQVVERL